MEKKMMKFDLFDNKEQFTVEAMIGILFAVIALSIVFTLLLAFPVMWLYNFVAVALHLPVVSYWVIAAILYLLGILASIFNSKNVRYLE